MKKVLPVFGLALLSSFGMAQIVYTDINPDEVLIAANDDSYTIDMDGGGVIDLVVFSSVKDTTISGFPVTITGVAITTLGNTEIIASTVTLGTETIVVADTLRLGHTIDAGGNYLNSNSPSVYSGVGLGVNGANQDLGDFIGNDTLYFGVKFDIGGSTHYGWVGVNIAGGATSGTLYDYAYEQTADTGIEAGQIAASDFVGIKKEVTSNVEMYSFDKKIIVKGDNIHGDLEVINLIGKTVYKKNIEGPKTLNLSELSEGIYLVTYSEGNQRLTKKVLIN